MEDKGHTRFKKAQGQLDLFSKDSIAIDKQILEKKTSTQVSFNSKDLINFIRIRSSLNKLSLDKINHLNNEFTAGIETADYQRIRKNISLIEKKIKRRLQNDRQISKEKSSALLDTFEQLSDVQNLFFLDISPANFPQLILNLNFFSGFQSCQILVHERGNPTITKYSCNRGIGHDVRKIKINIFHDIYNIIKKSKNKH